MRIVMGGKPGSGKGTQGKRIVECYDHLRHFSTGDILRQAEDEGAPAIRAAMAAGGFVDDATICEILASYLPHDNWVLDGSPRTVAQAQWLLNYASSDRPITRLIVMHIEDDPVIERLTNRRVCGGQDCNTIYNLIFAPPQVAGVCDIPTCRGVLYQREDDTEEAIIERLAKYGKETVSAYVTLREGGVTPLDIRADEHPDDIFRIIRESLEGKHVAR